MHIVWLHECHTNTRMVDEKSSKKKSYFFSLFFLKNFFSSFWYPIVNRVNVNIGMSHARLDFVIWLLWPTYRSMMIHNAQRNTSAPMVSNFRNNNRLFELDFWQTTTCYGVRERAPSISISPFFFLKIHPWIHPNTCAWRWINNNSMFNIKSATANTMFCTHMNANIRLFYSSSIYESVTFDRNVLYSEFFVQLSAVNIYRFVSAEIIKFHILW